MWHLTTGGGRNRAPSETALARRLRAPAFAQDIPPASTRRSGASSSERAACGSLSGQPASRKRRRKRKWKLISGRPGRVGPSRKRAGSSRKKNERHRQVAADEDVRPLSSQLRAPKLCPPKGAGETESAVLPHLQLNDFQPRAVYLYDQRGILRTVLSSRNVPLPHGPQTLWTGSKNLLRQNRSNLLEQGGERIEPGGMR